MEKKTKKIYYVAELNLPNTSAYSIHVMKMCEAIKKLGFNPSLVTISNHSLYKTLKNYNIDCKFNIIFLCYFSGRHWCITDFIFGSCGIYISLVGWCFHWPPLVVCGSSFTSKISIWVL